ncbi:MAG: tRNA pseudouridine(55) synthase TruB [Lachnospiraceae bacterium]|nr:tRNA pseudouridine(55) synthase TruB [Lachnospiraceae bacterium]
MKERGYTSNDVVAKLRGILRMKKIGHTGTLDPEATGVLPVCLGRATKLVGHLTDSDKTYRCVMRLGIATDTEDLTGAVTGVYDCSGIKPGDVLRIMRSFTGEYDQIPPMYSAKKVNGKRLYELAREGIEIERKPSRVYIRSITDTEFDFPETGDPQLSVANGSHDISSGEALTATDTGSYRVRFTVECSKGTYIRSLCRDIGARLGCQAAMESLERIRACGIDAADCLTLSEIERLVHEGDGIEGHILPVDHFFMELPEIRVSGQREKLVRNGNKFKAGNIRSGRYRVYLEDGAFAALYDIDNGEAVLCRLFLK